MFKVYSLDDFYIVLLNFPWVGSLCFHFDFMYDHTIDNFG